MALSIRSRIRAPRLVCRKLFEPAGELIQLPLPRQGRRLFPGWLLGAEARQGSPSIHSGDRTEKSQAVSLCWKPTGSKRRFEAVVSLQRCSTDCANARGARQFVRGIAPQGDEI